MPARSLLILQWYFRKTNNGTTLPLLPKIIIAVLYKATRYPAHYDLLLLWYLSWRSLINQQALKCLMHSQTIFVETVLTLQDKLLSLYCLFTWIFSAAQAVTECFRSFLSVSVFLLIRTVMAAISCIFLYTSSFVSFSCLQKIEVFALS